MFKELDKHTEVDLSKIFITFSHIMPRFTGIPTKDKTNYKIAKSGGRSHLFLLHLSVNMESGL